MSRAAPIDADVVVERLVAGGDGLGRLDDGRVVFVPGAVPGDRVRVRGDGRRDFVRATTVQLLEPGPDRVDAPCPHRRRGCGGCDWQHVAHQLAHKVDIARESFHRLGRFDHPFVAAGGEVPAWAYRTTVRLAAGRDGSLGLRAARSHEVVALPGCAVLHPALESLLAAGLRLDRPGAEVLLRTSTSHAGITASLTDGARLVGSAELLATVDARPDAVVQQRIGDVTLRVSAPSFFQSGPDAAELLVATVRNGAGTSLGGRTLDAYGGVGLFAAALGVTDGLLVESSPSAIGDARCNVAAGVSVVESSVEAWSPEPVDLVIADPSRRGLEAGAVEVLAATGATRIVLVSCDPAAAARDGARLVARGYHPGGARVLDLFPQTHHVEVVARYDRCHTDETEFW